MVVVYRAEKGAPLTCDELDGNFRELVERVERLETNPSQAEAIGNIQLVGQQLVITGTRGTEFGKFKLPTLAIYPCGEWKSEAAYAVNDLVYKGACAYLCIEAHTSKTFDKEVKHWRVLLDAALLRLESRSPTIPAPQSRLPLYETATLPKATAMGSLALVVNDSDGPTVIYADGKGWRRVNDKTIMG